MLLINNNTHTVKHNGVSRNYIYNEYTIFERCEILGIKIEVKHPTFKKKVLENYKLCQKV